MEELVKYMNEINLVNVFGLLIIVLVGIVAIKITVTFNINDYLKSRHEKDHAKAINACPHTVINMYDDETIVIESRLISPPGTVQWHCQKCGHITSDSMLGERLMKHYSGNVDELLKQEKRFQKVLKKSGNI